VPGSDIECRIHPTRLNDQSFGIVEAPSGLLPNPASILCDLDPGEDHNLLSPVERCHERKQWLRSDISSERLCRGDQQTILISASWRGRR
jgi:hypothetical protein